MLPGDANGMSTFTQSDMQHQLTHILDGNIDAVSVDFDQIIETIQRRYGTVPLDVVPSEEFWTIVAAAVRP